MIHGTVPLPKGNQRLFQNNRENAKDICITFWPISLDPQCIALWDVPEWKQISCWWNPEHTRTQSQITNVFPWHRKTTHSLHVCWFHWNQMNCDTLNSIWTALIVFVEKKMLFMLNRNWPTFISDKTFTKRTSIWCLKTKCNIYISLKNNEAKWNLNLIRSINLQQRGQLSRLLN